MLHFTKSLFFSLILLYSGFSCFAQSTLSGVIKDTVGTPLPAVSVLIKPENSQAIIAFTSTDSKGHYQLTTSKTGNFILNAKALSYKATALPILLSENETIIKDIILQDAPTTLNEVIIQSEKAITIKKDTIIFNADSFKQGNETVVEDLLKKIPGLTISEDGKIKVGDKEVEKVMVEGDDFFEKGYSLLTKNMSADAIDKVELYQKYSSNRLLKGIENSDKIALNLTLREDKKLQWFGNMSAGYGAVSENRYSLRTNLMSFGKKNKYYFLTNLNNTGEDAIGDIASLIYSGDADAIGNNESTYSLLDVSASQPALKLKRINFNNAELLSLNSIFKLSDKVKMKTIFFLNQDENDYFRNGFESFNLNGTAFTNTESYQLRKKRLVGMGKIDLTCDISKTALLEYSGKYNSGAEKNRSDLNFNDTYTHENLKTTKTLIDQKIRYTHKINDNGAFLISGRYIRESRPQDYHLNQFFYEGLFPGIPSDNIAQFSENKMQFAGFESHYMNKRKNGSLLELKLGSTYRKDQLFSGLALNAHNVVVAEPEGYQNATEYISNDLYFTTKYHYKFGNYTFLANADLHQLHNALQTATIHTRQSPFFVNPRLGIEWEINKTNKLLASYSINTSNSGILDVYDQYVLTSFRNFSKGTGSFNQLQSSSTLLNYTLGNWGKNFLGNLYIMYTQNHDFFTTNSRVTPNYSLSDKILVKDRNMLGIGINVDRYLKFITSNVKLNVGYNQSNYKNSVNDSGLREVTSVSYNYGAELRSGFRNIYNYHLGANWSVSEIKTNIKNTFTNSMFFMDHNFNFNSKLNLEIKTERYYFSTIDKSNNTYYFMDVEAKYTVKQNKLSFSVSGNNLFNTTTFRNYSVSDISISSTEYRLLPRYVLLKMDFRF